MRISTPRLALSTHAGRRSEAKNAWSSHGVYIADETVQLPGQGASTELKAGDLSRSADGTWCVATHLSIFTLVGDRAKHQAISPALRLSASCSTNSSKRRTF